MSDQPTTTNPPADAAPLKRVFKIGTNRIVEDAATAQLSNEQVRNLLKAQFPEVANATVRATVNDDTRVVEYLPQPGRKGSAMFTSLDVQGLVDCLSHVPPVELKATRMLQDLRLTSSGGWFPAVPPDSVAEATQELITYTKSCAALVEKLKYLAPIILTDLELPEWPL